MVDHSYRMNGEVNTPLSSGFAEKIHHDWVKSENPETIMTCKQTDDVLIFPNKNLCCRSTSNNVIFSWDFQILANGKCRFFIVFTFVFDKNKQLIFVNDIKVFIKKKKNTKYQNKLLLSK